MCEVVDASVAANALIETLRRTFTLKHEIGAVCSLVHQFSKLLASEGTNWDSVSRKHLYSLIVLFQKMAFFVQVNFDVRERAPRVLPCLRKMRTLLKIRDLQAEFLSLFAELEHLFVDGPLQEKFSAEFLAEIFSEAAMEQKLIKDFNHAKKYVRKTFKELESTCEDKGLVEELRGVVDAFMANTEDDEGFTAFARLDFAQSVPRVDECLLMVNRNIEHVVVKGQQKKRLVETVQEDNVDFEEDERDSSLFKGHFGSFFFGEQLNDKEWSRPILVQKIDMSRVKELPGDEILLLGHFLRKAEMMPKKTAAKECALEAFGHLEMDNSLVAIYERPKVSLSVLLKLNKKALGRTQIVHLAMSLFKALEALHSVGVVHGCIRPENIFYSKKAYTGQVKIANFFHGLNLRSEAKEVLGRQEKPRDVIYKAPEVLIAESYTYACDMYSSGAVLWECLQPGLFLFDSDLPSASVEGVKRKVTSGEKHPLDYLVHTSHVKVEERLNDKQWAYFEEAVDMLLHVEPWNRPTSGFMAEEFSNIKNAKDNAVPDSKEDRKKFSSLRSQPWEGLRQSLLLRNTVSSLKPPPPPQKKKKEYAATASLPSTPSDREDEGDQEENPMYRGTILPAAPPQFRPARKTIAKPKAPARVQSMGRHTRKTDILNGYVPEKQKTEDKKTEGHKTGSTGELQKYAAPKAVVDLSNAEMVGDTVFDEIGFDDLPRSEVRKELLLWKKSVEDEGIDLENSKFVFDLDMLTKKCWERGLQKFHNEAFKKFGIGLPRFGAAYTNPNATLQSSLGRTKLNRKKTFFGFGKSVKGSRLARGFLGRSKSRKSNKRNGKSTVPRKSVFEYERKNSRQLGKGKRLVDLADEPIKEEKIMGEAEEKKEEKVYPPPFGKTERKSTGFMRKLSDDLEV